jgi:hypothetical protein
MSRPTHKALQDAYRRLVQRSELQIPSPGKYLREAVSEQNKRALPGEKQLTFLWVYA